MLQTENWLPTIYTGGELSSQVITQTLLSLDARRGFQVMSENNRSAARFLAILTSMKEILILQLMRLIRLRNTEETLFLALPLQYKSPFYCSPRPWSYAERNVSPTLWWARMPHSNFPIVGFHKSFPSRLILTACIERAANS